MDLKRYEGYITVGELLNYIKKNNISRDGKVLIQRVEDKYFEGCDISGYIGKLPDGTYGRLPEGSKGTPWETMKKDTDQGISEYIPIWCPVKYDEDNLYLDAHY